MQSNDMAGIKFRQPKDFAERFGVAEQCSIRLDMKSPVLIDNIANTTCEDYAAFPDRLYIIDMDGKVAYKGGRGPFGYKPREMEQSLLLVMMEAQIKARQNKSKSEKNPKETSPNPRRQPSKQSDSPPAPITPPNEIKKPNVKKPESKKFKKSESKKPKTRKPVPPGPDLPESKRKKFGRPRVGKIVGLN